jgi:hypothetical protein
MSDDHVEEVATEEVEVEEEAPMSVLDALKEVGYCRFLPFFG